MSNRLRRSLIAVASLCFLGIGTVQAQPTNKPIRLIVPYAAGGPIDVTAR
jgi:tripartite-type tricarboxylate transporter receptor subunit TctC